MTDEEVEPAPPYVIEDNSDGSAIVKLAEPFDLRGETYSRLTMPRLTGRHMRAAGWTVGSPPTVGEALEWANEVFEPRGALYELPALVARDLAMEVSLVLVGKSKRSAGAGRSPA